MGFAAAAVAVAIAVATIVAVGIALRWPGGTSTPLVVSTSIIHLGRLVWGHELIQGTLEKYARDTFSRRPVVNDGKVSQLQSPIMHAVANALLVC